MWNAGWLFLFIFLTGNHLLWGVKFLAGNLNIAILNFGTKTCESCDFDWFPAIV